MFALSNSPIRPEELKRELADENAGALATFEGWVRNKNDGRLVTRLEYEAFEPLAKKEANKIIAEALAKFDLLQVSCIHRTGSLGVGDLAVWVGATAVHRKDALLACRYVIDQVKYRVPIWKKEHYVNGPSEWINCTACTHDIQPADHDNKISEPEFYSRQILLREIGFSGQKALNQSRVLVVGAGGLGASALLYLAGAGVGTIGICEHDCLEASNLHRQVIYGHRDLGRPKVELAARQLQQLNPFVKVVEHAQMLDETNADAILGPYDIVLDCSDNFATKFLLNDICVKLRKTLVQASVYQFEGQLHLIRANSENGCLRCLWQDTPDSHCVDNCAVAGVLGAVPGVFGVLQATEAVKVILGLPTPLDRCMLLMNLNTYEVSQLKRIRNPNCACCGQSARLVCEQAR